MGAVMIQHIAPCVVDISHNRVPVAVHNLNHIALCILDVQICGSVIRHRRGTQAVVGEVHPIATPGQVRQGVAQVGIIVRCAVDCLGNALAVGIVAVGDAAAGLAHGRQLTAMLPGIGPCAVGQGVAYGVVGDGFPVIRRQQVSPLAVVVAIGDGAPHCTQRTGGIGIFFFAENIAAIVIGIDPRLARCLVVLTDQAVKFVIVIRICVGPVRHRQNIAPRIVCVRTVVQICGAAIGTNLPG